MKKDELLKNWENVVRKGKEETEKWILSLSDENIKIIYGNEDLRELITKMIKDIFMSEIKKGIN